MDAGVTDKGVLDPAMAVDEDVGTDSGVSGLEGRGREFYGSTGEPRTWFNIISLATAPAEANIPDGPNGMGGSALTNEYYDNAWYELQMLLNSGNHRH